MAAEWGARRRMLVKLLEDVPLRDGLACLREHLVPVLHLDRAALRSQNQLPDGRA